MERSAKAPALGPIHPLHAGLELHGIDATGEHDLLNPERVGRGSRACSRINTPRRILVPLYGLPAGGGNLFVHEALRLVHPVALALVMLMQGILELPAKDGQFRVFGRPLDAFARKGGVDL